MVQKFSWLIFFILLSSIASPCLLFIPYSETKTIAPGYPMRRIIFYNSDPHIFIGEFPWRSHSQKLFLNISAEGGTISFHILNYKNFINYWREEPYLPYTSIENITELTTTIKLSPPFQETIWIIFYSEYDFPSQWYEISFFIEITITYIRYASSYGFFFLGIAVILISYYGYRRYKWRNKNR